MLDINLASYWIYRALTTDATITGIVGARVYRDFAPQGKAMPCIVFQVQSSEDVNTAGVNRIFTSHTIVVKAIDKNGGYSGDVATLAGRIDALLHNVNEGVSITMQSGAVATGYCWSWRTRPFNLAETTDGVQFRHLGGVYRVQAQVYGVTIPAIGPILDFAIDDGVLSGIAIGAI